MPPPAINYMTYPEYEEKEFSFQILYIIDAEKLKEVQILLRDFLSLRCSVLYKKSLRYFSEFSSPLFCSWHILVLPVKCLLPPSSGYYRVATVSFLEWLNMNPFKVYECSPGFWRGRWWAICDFFPFLAPFCSPYMKHVRSVPGSSCRNPSFCMQVVCWSVELCASSSEWAPLCISEVYTHVGCLYNLYSLNS